jgi:formylglycine-generating enzyme required for sulfatase activity
VENVSWEAITNSTSGFLKKLNDLTGKNYRLPTEAEWEYAARGCCAGVCEGYTYSGSSIIGDVAYCDVSGGPTTVGSKRANALGLYDMSGNVWEWCSDWCDNYYGAGSSSALSSTTRATPIVNPTGASSGSGRARRGGSWSCGAGCSRVVLRNSIAPSNSSDDYGFRLV